MPTAAAEVQTLLARLHSEEPFLPSTEAVLRCHAKRRLYRSFMQAGVPAVANWLFSNSDQPFHNNITTTPSFAASIAVRAQWKCDFSQAMFTFHPPCSNSQDDLSSQIPGRDILFVPVAVVSGQNRVVGYTFGAGIGPDVADAPCPFGRPGSVFLPHAVGRFSFDPVAKDLLIVAHGLANGCTGIMHLRDGGDDVESGDHHKPPNGQTHGVNSQGARQRTWYVVPGANYGHRRLPGRVLAMLRIPEKQIPSTPTFQFDEPSPSSKQRMKLSLQESMALLERLVKGRYASDKACRDEMDFRSGQVVSRITFSADIDFDVDSAIAANVFKDLAVRNFYAYMSTAANMPFSPTAPVTS